MQKKDNFCSEAAPRIAEERERLGFTQEEIATACGVSRVMWGKYERGGAAMGGEYLFAFAAQGADVNYVLTGQRSNTVTMLSAREERAGYSVEVLSKDEQALLDNYRHCPQEGKQQLEATSALFSQLTKKKA